MTFARDHCWHSTIWWDAYASQFNYVVHGSRLLGSTTANLNNHYYLLWKSPRLQQLLDDTRLDGLRESAGL